MVIITEESYIQKPLIERIYDEMFRIIEINKRFKDVEIQTLREITYKKNFKKENSFTFY